MIRNWLLTAGLLLAPVLLTAAAKEPCAACHEQPAKIVGSVHADLGCGTCHTDHEKYPHKKSEKPKCADCHEEIVAQHALSIHGQEIKKGNAGAPECSTCHGGVHEIKSTRSAEFHQGVPDTCGMCHTDVADAVPGQRARPGAGARRHRKRRSAPTATANTISKPPKTRNRPSTPQHSRHLRVLPCRRPPEPQVRICPRPDQTLRRLLPRARRQGRVADRGQLRQLPRRSQHPAFRRPEVHRQRQESPQDLRQVPSGNQRPLRDQSGPCR